MKRYFSIIFVAFLLAFVACNSNNEELDRDYTGNNKVVISAKSLGAITRSADTDPESTVAWLDVYVMDADKKIIYSERIDKSSAPVIGSGEFVLGKNRDEFEQDESYYIYMIANSTAPIATDADVETWDDLKTLTQTDRDLHLSGWGIENNDVKSPKYFLMDGFAYVPANVNDVGPNAMEAFVINDGGDDNIELAGTLYRAAAKIVLNITQGDNVKFETVLDGATPLYSFYQLPISTLVVTPEADTRFVSEKQTTGEWGIDNKLFNFIQKDGKPMLTLLGYAYANDWNKEAANESSLLLSIPMMWDKDGDKSTGVDGKEASSPVNWYKVPLSKNNKFERNTCYIINININAIGAEEKNTPIELKDIEYVTLPWQEVQVEIGQTIAKYLTLNTDVVKIYDKNFDLDQLTFTSSSPIKSIKLKDTFSHNVANSSLAALPLENEILDDEEVDDYVANYTGGDGLYAYYIDKFGQKVQLGTDPGFDLMDVDHTDWTKEDILAKENNLYNKDGVAYNEQYIRAEVPAGQERALNGDIHIYSPIYADAKNADLDWNSHFNTVRYLEFEVMNEQGITATFRVEQMPLTVISNIEGFFSYRSDFHIGDGPVYHNPADWVTPTSGGGSYVNVYGRDNIPTSKSPAHLLNPSLPMFSFSGFQAYHVDNVAEDGRFITGQTSCGSGSYEFEEILYGNMPRNYYRTLNGPINGTFHRGHYYYTNNGHFNAASMWKNNNSNASAYYQAVGFVYSDIVNGETKYHRRHYTGNLFETFQSKIVHIVHNENDEGRTQPILEEFWYCPTCTVDRTYNTEGKYVSIDDCKDPKAHKKSFYNGYYDTGRTKKIVRGMSDIYKVMAGGEGEEWITFTALNPMILKPLIAKDAKTWTINRTQVPGAILHNHRMYHVRVTSTSTDYVIADPQMMDENGNHTNDKTNGITMEGKVNSSIVSPSFMIASELGETIIPQDEAHYVMPGIKTIYELAKSQCREYVETRYVDDDNSGDYTPGDRVYHYDDWRLPTRAEIDYIIKHQESSRAMDKVLSAQYYLHASTQYGQYDESTLISNEIPGYDEALKGWYMRCVRDAYKEPTPVTYSNGIPSVLQK